MTGIGTIRAAASNDATQRYDEAKAKLETMDAAQGRHDAKDWLLPHENDGWMLRALKFTVPIGLAGAAIGGAMAGVGALTGKADLVGRGASLAAGAGFLGAIPLFAGLLGPFMHALPDPLDKDTPEVAKQRELVRDLLERTPEWSKEHEQGFEEIAKDLVIKPYDHDGDGELAIGPAAAAGIDERVRSSSEEGGPARDGASKVTSAYSTFRQFDTNGDQRLTAEEAGGWVQAFDTNDTGRVSWSELADAELTERSYDQYAEFVDTVASQP